MLEGTTVENTPEEWIRQIENWVAAYPEEGRSIAAALADSTQRINGTGLYLTPRTWAMIGEPEPRRWLIDLWLPAGTVALLTGEGGAGKSRLALQLAAGIATNHSDNVSWIEGAEAPKPKPRWDVHLQYIGDWAGILAEILRPLIAGRCGSGP